MVLHELSLYLLDHKKYGESILYLKRAVKLYPDDLELLINLANLYVYNNEYNKAKVIYRAHQNDRVGTKSWRELFQFYIKYYKEHNYDVRIFDDVFKDLGIKKED